MGKEGPCHHCGVTSTPLWRNGPPDKPVLCNACGSRWRTKGTLANYTPLHSRLSFDDAPNTPRVSLPNRDAPITTPKRMRSHDDTVPDVDTFTVFPKGFDEDVSNPSSSGSAVSIAESCAQFGPTDASCDFTGVLPSNVWDSAVPSRKRTCVGRLNPPSHFEKLTRDLYTIFYEQSSFSVSSDDDLLLGTDTPMVSVETGHGSILIRHPTASSSAPLEEESESSSLSVEKRLNYPSNGLDGSRHPPPFQPLHMERLKPERHLTHGSLDLPEEIARFEGLEGNFIEEEQHLLSKLDDRELEP